MTDQVPSSNPSTPPPSASPTGSPSALRPQLRTLFPEDATFPIILPPSTASSRSPPPSPPPSAPYPSSSPLPPIPNSAVSLRDYFASEFVASNVESPRFTLSFAPAPALPIPSPPANPSPTLSSPAARDLSPHDLPRSETLPNLAALVSSQNPTPNASPSSSPSPAHSITLVPNPSPPPPPPQFLPPPADSRLASRTHWRLDCLQLLPNGDITPRALTRSQILYEARATMHDHRSNTVTLAHMLSAINPSLPAVPAPDGRRATQKALRDYLRNSLQARDIRQVDPAFAAKPALWVRHSAIVVSLAGLRAIILCNKMFLFDPLREDTKELGSIAQKCVLVNPDSDNPQPFEFNALEGILIFLVMRLEREYDELKPQIDQYLHQMPSDLTTKMLEELRRKKQQLNHFHSRASSVKTVLENLVDDDEEMANMYLTEKQMSMDGGMRNSQEHVEVETLLEAYLQVIDEHVNQATLLNDAIDDTEDLVMIHLDTFRNRLLSVELTLSVVSMAMAGGGMIAGLFGMNLRMPWFEASASTLWFPGVVGTIVVSVVSMSWIILVGLRRRGLYSVY